MRKIFLIALIFLLFTVPISKTVASSKLAYQDYLYQFDRYRQTYADFQRARDTYLKYHSLTSQTTAVMATGSMMTQRNLLIRSYLLFLNEKLNENQGLTGTAKQQYQGNLQREIAFLDAQNQQIAEFTSIDEATNISKLLETHYMALQITIRQTIVGLTMGKLLRLSMVFDQNLQTAQALVSDNATVLTPEKVGIINRWLIQIQNTRSLYQQQLDEIATLSTTKFATVRGIQDLEQKSEDMNKKFTVAQRLLTQMTSYLGEVATALQYQ